MDAYYSFKSNSSITTDVTVVIPTYFGNNMLINCVSSILKNVKSPKIYIDKNDVGWLKACNTAMGLINSDIILLNDDTLVLTDIVKEMHDLAYSDPKIGIVGGKSLDPSGTRISNYGIYLGSDGNTAHKHFGQPRDSVGIESQKAVEGSCMYIKADLMSEIGDFDEGYGMGYREELDYCLRAREAGWKVVSCPTAEYIHFVSQTNARLNITNDTYDYFMSKWGTKLKLGQV